MALYTPTTGIGQVVHLLGAVLSKTLGLIGLR